MSIVQELYVSSLNMHITHTQWWGEGDRERGREEREKEIEHEREI